MAGLGALETATAVAAGSALAVKGVETASDFAKAFGIADIFRRAIAPILERSRSVAVKIENKTSEKELFNIQCYTHCGRNEGHPMKSIGPQGTDSIQFVNGKFKVFGASGCMSLWYTDDKRVVIIYKVPQKNRNTVAIALLDEKALKQKYRRMEDAELYFYFKKPRRKIVTIDFQEKKEKSARQLHVRDKDLGLWFECSITGGPNAELTMTMYCKGK